MKKILTFLLGIFSVCALASCDLSALMGGTSVESDSEVITESVTSEETTEHKHTLTRVSERKSSCTAEGNITYWVCDCGVIFTDAMGKNEATKEEIGEAVAVVAQQNHMTVEQLKPYYDAEFEQAIIRSILTGKVMHLIREAANIAEV